MQCIAGTSSKETMPSTGRGVVWGDIAHYLRLSMLMGIIRLPNLKLYWSNENLFKFPVFECHDLGTLIKSCLGLCTPSINLQCQPTTGTS